MPDSIHNFAALPHFNELSYWEKETYINHTDYLIVGSGIVGLSTAIHLKQRNPYQKVTVLERGFLPSGASTKNAGFSCIGSPSELLADLEKGDEKGVFETVKKRWEGLTYLRQLLGDQTIEYLEEGSYELFRAEDDKRYEKCCEKIPYLNAHLAEITGIKTVFTPHSDICLTAGFKGFTHAISHAAEGQINTGKMMLALVQKAIGLGIIILNGIEAKTIENSTLKTNYGAMDFKKIAICTNGFARQFLPAEDVLPARAQVIVSSPVDDLKFKGIYHFDEGYYYFRNIGNRILLGGGRNLNFKAEETTELKTSRQIMEELEYILKNRILPDTQVEIEHSWAGIMGVGKTKAPIVKKVGEGIFCGVRLGGMGVAIGTSVGKELADLMGLRGE